MNANGPRELNPFPGLRPFRSDEDYLFFGREQQTSELLVRLRDHRLIAVVGTSGSGKSSLVRAGLLPELQGGTLNRAGSAWEIALLRPGADPITHLARALQDTGLYNADDADVIPQLVATLRRSATGLAEALRQSTIEPHANLLVVVDQFEELFRYRETRAANQETAEAFVNLLLEAADQRIQPVYIVLTMRSDYLGDCSQFRGLAEAVNRGEYLIPCLSRDQLRLVIEGPIKVCGGKITFRLLQQLLNDVARDRDQLPVLQHALMRAWDHWMAHCNNDEPFDLHHYEAVGEMHGALSRHADEIYDDLANDRLRVVAEKVFKTLTERGPDNRGIRRPTQFDQLCEVVSADADDVSAVLQAFRQGGRTFLTPSEPAELRIETVIDLSHESLMRGWQRLDHWVEEEAQSARIYRRLAETAALHLEQKADLYHDPDLQIALSWREIEGPNASWAHRYHPGFDAALAFLEQSQAAKQEQEEIREAARLRELEQARAVAEAERSRAEEQARFATRLKWLVRGLGLVAIVAIVALLSAIWAQRLAQRNAELAHQNERMAQRSAAEAGRQADRATEKAREVEAANRQVRTTLSRSDLFRAEHHFEADNHPAGLAFLSRALRNDPENSQATQGLRELLLDYRLLIPREPVVDLPAEIRVARFNANGRSLLAALSNGGVAIWTLAQDPALRPLAGSARQADGVALSADGRLFLTYSSNRVDVASLEENSPARTSLVHSAAVVSAEFDPEDRMVLTGSLDGSARIWEARTGTLVRELTSTDGALMFARFSPDGSFVLTVPEQGPARLWNTATGAAHGDPLQNQSGVTTVDFSSDSRWLATGSKDGIARIWSTTSGQAATVPLLHAEALITVRLSPGGDRLATSDRQGMLRLWDVATGRTLAEKSWRASADFLEFMPISEQLLAASSHEGLWRLWNSVTLVPLTHDTPVDRRIDAARFSRDGRAVLMASGLQIMVWPIRLGRAVKDSLTFAGHTHGFEFSRDGSRVVGLSHQTTNWWLNSWERSDPAASRRTINLPFGDSISSARLLPGGLRVLTLAENRRNLRLWDTASRKAASPELAPKGFLTSVWNVACSPDGLRLVTQSRITNGLGRVFMELWRTADGSAQDLPLNSSAAVTAAEFSSDGRTLVIGSVRGEVTFWDVESGEQQAVSFSTGSSILELRLDATADRLLTVSRPGTLQFWKTATGDPISPVLTDDHVLFLSGFAGRGDVLFASSRSEGRSRMTVRFWRSTDMGMLDEIQVALGPLAIAPDGRTVVDYEGKIHTALLTGRPVAPAWADELAEGVGGYRLTAEDRLEPVLLADRLEQRRAAQSLTGEDPWSQWGRWVVADAYRRTTSPTGLRPAETWLLEQIKSGGDLARQEAIGAFPCHPGVLDLKRHPVDQTWLATLANPTVRILADPGIKSTWAPDGQRFAFGLVAGKGIQVVDPTVGTVTLITQNGKDPLWSPKGDDILYVAEIKHQEYSNEEVWLTDASGDIHRKLLDGTFPSWLADGQTVVAYSHRERHLVSVRLDEPDRPPRIFYRDPPSWYCAVSPDGQSIAAGRQRQFVIIDRDTREELVALPIAGLRGILPTWSPDQTRVAFGGYNTDPGGLWVYDLVEKRAFQVAHGPCTMAAWSPDGGRLSFDYRPQDTDGLRIWVVEMEASETSPEDSRVWPEQAEESL